MTRKPSGNIRSASAVLPASRRPLPLAISAALVSTLTMGAARPAAAQTFPNPFPLASLNGSNGFRLDGATVEDQSGFSVSAAGDINGDGIDDLIIGARFADPNGSYSGSSYVVFGGDTGSAGNFPAVLPLSGLDGSNGFRLDGAAAGDQSGVSVSAAGDINGDGIGDLIIGAPIADPSGSASGSSYVVFGRDTAGTGNFPATFALSSLDGSNGFRLDGAARLDFSGQAVSGAGDINGDGIDDLIIGALGADPNGSDSGSSYVVFGRDTGSVGTFPAVLPLSGLDGSNGFRLDGAAAGDFSGISVSAAGDINGDGIDDLVIGAYGADPNGSRSGSSYVVFGVAAAGALEQPAALLVYPLVDSLNGGLDTVIDIANTGNRGTWVQCNIEVHGPGAAALVKEDFQIYLTPFQKIWWKLSRGYSAQYLANKYGLPKFSIPPYAHSKGFLYCFAIDGATQFERDWDYLKGGAVVYGGGQAFQYNAIPHQVLAIVPNGVLDLDGVEYTAGPSRIWFEGIAAGVDFGAGEVGGTLTLASIDADFKASLQTDFDVNYTCWNRKEQRFSRHRHVHVFAQHDLTVDLKMDIANLRSDAFMCGADTHLTGDGDRTPVWAVFQQHAGPVTWGANVWHDHDPVHRAPTTIVLPDNGVGSP